MENKSSNPLLMLGIGMGVGACALWVVLELWPLLVLGGAAYLIYKGISMPNTQEESKKNATMDEG